MSKFIAAAKKFAVAEEGASLVEYALLVALIACACIVTLQSTGTAITGLFGRVNTKLGTVTVP